MTDRDLTDTLFMNTGQHDLDLDSSDEETLYGHYLIARIDGRLEDQDLLGRELIRRGADERGVSSAASANEQG